PHDRVRSNSLAVVDNLLLVAYQVKEAGGQPAGVGIYDIQDPEHPRQVGFFDTSGPHSRGVHVLWFVDGQYAHLSSGMPDFVPSHPRDDQFYVIIDVRDPIHPVEAGRWWIPGTRQGDPEPPPPRHQAPAIESGYRLHYANVYPQRPDRAYLGYIDAGVIILDISDKAHPQMISRVDYHPPFPGMSHTAMPLFDRGLLVVTDEATRDHGEDWPKLVWIMDIREERNPVIISTCPLPPVEEFSQRGGRFGTHNVHENIPLPISWVSDRYIVGAFFNAGVRVFDLANPFRPEEVAHFVPPAPPNSPVGAIQMNDVYVDERGLVYAIDRFTGGLYIMEMSLP
ncbi:MAG: LVIVD repeat-containing protein, partial [Dehalococcoidia bacterium]